MEPQLSCPPQNLACGLVETSLSVKFDPPDFGEGILPHDVVPTAPLEPSEIQLHPNCNKRSSLNFSPKFAVLQRSMKVILEKQQSEIVFYKHIRQSRNRSISELNLAKKEYQMVKENIPILQQIIEYLSEQHIVLQKEDDKILNAIKKHQHIELECDENNNQVEKQALDAAGKQGTNPHLFTAKQCHAAKSISDSDNLDNVSKYFNKLAALRHNEGTSNLQMISVEIQRRETKNRQQTSLHQQQLQSQLLHKSLIKETMFELEKDIQRWTNIMQVCQTMLKRLKICQNKIWKNMRQYYQSRSSRLSQEQVKFYKDVESKISSTLNQKKTFELDQIDKLKVYNCNNNNVTRSKSKSPIKKKQKYKKHSFFAFIHKQTNPKESNPYTTKLKNEDGYYSTTGESGCNYFDDDIDSVTDQQNESEEENDDAFNTNGSSSVNQVKRQTKSNSKHLGNKSLIAKIKALSPARQKQIQSQI